MRVRADGFEFEFPDAVQAFVFDDPDAFEMVGQDEVEVR